MRISLSVEQRLPLPHHAEHMIVEHDLYKRPAASHRSRDLIHIHTETSVSRDVDNCFIRTSHLRSDSRAQAVSHGSQAAGSKKSSWIFELVILSGPHLMLSHVCCDDSVAAGKLIEFLDNIRAGKLRMIITQR